jgi:hypothetical protein
MAAALELLFEDIIIGKTDTILPYGGIDKSILHLKVEIMCLELQGKGNNYWKDKNDSL